VPEPTETPSQYRLLGTRKPTPEVDPFHAFEPKGKAEPTFPKLKREFEKDLRSYIKEKDLLPPDLRAAMEAYLKAPGNEKQALFFEFGKGGLKGVEWLADQMNRAQSMVTTAFFGGLFDKKDEERNIAQRAFQGWRLDPGSIRPYNVLIPDEAGEVDVPLLHRYTGLKFKHFEPLINIVTDPSVYMTGPAGAPFALTKAVAKVGKAGETIRLTERGAGLAETFRLRAYDRELAKIHEEAASIYRTGGAKALEEKGLLGMADDPEAILKAAGGKALEAEGMLLYGKAAKVDNPVAAAVSDAHMAIHRVSSWRAQRAVERVLGAHPEYAYEPGLYFSGRRLIVPKKVLDAPFRAVWGLIPGRGHISNWPNEALNTTSSTFGEIRRPARQIAPWIGQARSEQRAVRSRVRGETGRVLADYWRGVPKKQRVAIGKYMGLGRNTKRLNAIDPQYRHLIDGFGEIMANLHEVEVRQGIPISERALYYPIRKNLRIEHERELNDALLKEAGLDKRGEIVRPNAIQAGAATFRNAREYETIDEAIEHWQKLGLSFASDAKKNPEKFFVVDAGEAMSRRFQEHAKYIGDRHFVQTIALRVGVNPDELAEKVIRLKFPHEMSVLDANGVPGKVTRFSESLTAALGHVSLPKTIQEIARAAGAKKIGLPTATFRETMEDVVVKGIALVDKAPSQQVAATLVNDLRAIQTDGDALAMARFRKQLSGVKEFEGQIGPDMLGLVNHAGDEAVSLIATDAAASGETSALRTLLAPKELSSAVKKSVKHVHEALKLDEAVRAGAAGLTKAKGFAQQDLQALKAHVSALNDRERAFFLEAAARDIDSSESLARFYALYREHIETIRITDVEAVRKTMQIRRKALTDYYGRDFVPLEAAGINKELNAIYVPETIRDEFVRLDHIGQKLTPGAVRTVRVYDWMLNRFKASTTALWPAFAVRNAMSDMATAWTEIGVGLFNPEYAWHAFNIVAGRNGFMKVNGRLVPYEAERAYMKDLHALGSPYEFVEVLADDGRSYKALRSIFQKVEAPERWHLPGVFSRIPGTEIKASALEINAARENFGRAYMYIYQRYSRGASPEMAAAMVNKLYIDYAALSPFERDWMKRVFTFPTWNTRNVGIQLYHLKQNPGRIAAQLRFFGQDYGPDEAFLPEYVRGEFKLGAKFDESGKFKFITGIDLPIQSAIDLVWPGDARQLLTNLVSQLSPARAVTHKDLEETSRQYLGVTGEIASRLPEKVKGWMEYREKPGRDGKIYRSVNAAKFHIFVRSTVLSRFASTTDRMARYVGEEGWEFQRALLDFVSGFRYEEFDLDDRQKALVNANIKFLEREAAKAGVTEKFEITFKPKRPRR
jgi:hypothetical protein